MTTLAQVNKALAPLKLELVKEFDYFWFFPAEGYESEVPTSVFVRRINDLTLDQWLEAAKETI